VVTSHHRNGLVLNNRLGFSLYPGQLNPEDLQATQGVRRLRELHLARLGGVHGGHIQGANMAQRMIKQGGH
jgi:hypothetical protein